MANLVDKRFISTRLKAIYFDEAQILNEAVSHLLSGALFVSDYFAVTSCEIPLKVEMMNVHNIVE